MMLEVERTFVPYGASHWAVMSFLAGGALLLVVLGRRLSEAEGVRVGRTFAVVMAAFLVPMLVYRLTPSQWDVHVSLPLHLCDLAWMVAAFALWTRSWWAYVLTFYWGLTLTPQAMITPALDAPDFPHLDFIDFWAQHCLVVWAAVYLTWGVRMRPDWRGYRVAIAITLVWAVGALGFNEVFGTNYGFVSAKPSNPSILDLMGGWPWYLGVELVVGATAWALVTWPWTRQVERAPS